jgi:acetylornithine/N-succinyldiaminopimelate aminotransferase
MSSTPTSLFWYPGHELALPRIVRAENCHLFDDQGKRYVDLESGVWCTVLGHRHPRIRQTIGKQFDRIAHSGFGYSCEVVARAAEDLLALLDFNGGRCVFLCSGSEAVEFAVRTARMAMLQPRMLTFADSYFGAYGAAHSKAPEKWFLFDWLPCCDCPPERTCDAACERWGLIPFDSIGGFLFEPGSSGGLVRFAPPKLIDSIVTAVRAQGGLVAVNEVTTGMGRTGAWFGHQHYHLVPDIVALGKGLGNGYPVSATAVAPQVLAAIGDREIAYAQSHQNDPMGAAVVREVIAIIQEADLIERGRRIGARLQEGLEAIRERTGRLATIRSRGVMLAVELKDAPGAGRITRIHRDLVHRGYLVGRRPGRSVFRIDPALTIAREDVEGFLAALEAVLAGEDGRVQP